MNGVTITCHRDTCESFQEGSWPTLVSTTESRGYHSSVVHGDRLVLLGGYDTQTTEVIPPTGEAAMPGLYDISNGYYHCSIDIDDESVVVVGGVGGVGGVGTGDLVTEYNKLSGHPRTLPSLQEPRYGHACTWYTQGHDKVTCHHSLINPSSSSLPFLKFLLLTITPGPPSGRRAWIR